MSAARAAPIFALVLAALTASPAAAQTREGLLRKALIAALEARNGFPTRPQLLRLGKVNETNSVLADLAVDRHLPDWLRLNAVRALEYFPTLRSEEVLMTLLFERQAAAAYKGTCLRALARAYGVKVYFEVLPFLRDDAPRVRAAAAVALAEIDDGRVRGILENHLANEPDITVRLAMERAIQMVHQREVTRPQPKPEE